MSEWIWYCVVCCMSGLVAFIMLDGFLTLIRLYTDAGANRRQEGELIGDWLRRIIPNLMRPMRALTRRLQAHIVSLWRPSKRKNEDHTP